MKLYDGMTWLDYCEANNLTVQGTPRIDRGGPTYVYALQIKGTRYFKIGMSACPDVRVQQFQPWTPFPIEVALSVAFDSGREARRVEGLVHRKFARRRIRSEWFELSTKDVTSLKLLVFSCPGKLERSLKKRQKRMFYEMYDKGDRGR